MSEVFGRIQVVWDGLASRERFLVAIAGGAFALVILLVGIVMPIRSATERAVSAADQSARQLQSMTRMKREWDGLHGRLAEVESRIQGSQDQHLAVRAGVAGQAARAGVKPTSMEKRQSGESERYEETKVEVSLKNVTLAQAVAYLSSIETAAQPLSVKSLRVKRRPGRPTEIGAAAAELIDVTFSVSAFKPIS